MQETVQPQLIRYRQNSSEKITAVDTAMGDGYLSFSRSETKKYSSLAGRFVGNTTGVFDNNLRVTDDTVIFRVPADAEVKLASVEDFNIWSKSNLANEAYYNICTYNVDAEDGDAIGAMVIVRNSLIDAKLDIFSATIITDIYTSLNDEDDVVKYYKGLRIGNNTQITLQSAGTDNLLAEYKEGDILSYGLTPEGEVGIVSTEVIYGTTPLGTVINEITGDNWNGYTGMPKVMSAYGVITHKNGNFVNFVKTPVYKNGELVRGTMTYDLTGVRAYKFNTTNNEFTVMDPHEVASYNYENNPNASVYIHTSFADLTAPIVYVAE